MNDQSLAALVNDVIASFGPILKNNQLFFFDEYTDHGIEHIEMVLKAAEYIIPAESFQYIKSNEIAILILAIVLHDIGMHIDFSTFKAFINGEYDNVKVDVLDKKNWQELWLEYLSEIQHFSSKQKGDIFGNQNEIINEPDLSNKDKLTGTDKKIIGEFIRRHHARIAQEIALGGFIGNSTIPFGNVNLNTKNKEFVGIVARSHGMNIRDTFVYLEKVAYVAWKNPADMNIIFLMVLLRIADYLQIDKSRTDKNMLKIKTFNSPISLKEHQAHLSIEHLTFKNEDPELIVVTCEPKDAQMYVKLQELIKEIQHELDLSWAILGEIYGFLPDNKPKIKFRRIASNLEHPTFLDKIDYVPKKIRFEVNNELSKLLVAPLYGNDPKIGVRELVQNATDACKERLKIEQDKKNSNYEPLVTVSLEKKNDEQYLFTIKDNGKGMTLDEILNYFLSVGSSFRYSHQWKKDFLSKDNKGLIKRNGKFGIGVLATFLLGDEIYVKTKSYMDNSPAYAFKTNIDNEFIDVNIIDTFDIGTAIEISISTDKVTSLTQPKYQYYRYEILWTDWYISKIPKIKYFLDKKEVFSEEFLKPHITRTIFPQYYDKIQWTYENSGMFVACNDIIITLSSEKRYFQYNENRKSKLDEDAIRNIIFSKPSLMVDDVQGLLPLRLDRNDLDADVLPFEKDLLLDVSKDFIAQLLMLPFKMKIINDYEINPHNTEFLFFKNGFTLVCDYFQEKIPNEIILFRIITSDFKIRNHLLIYNESNHAIYPKFNKTINLTNQADNVAPEIGGYIYLPKEKYNNLFNTNKKRIPFWVKYSHKVERKTEEYIVYSAFNYKKKSNILDKEILDSIIINLGKEVQSIQEVPINILPKVRGGKILNGLFNKYFGNNFIIPYDMKERKQLYKEAFDDLKDYMKDYEKNSDGEKKILKTREAF